MKSWNNIKRNFFEIDSYLNCGFRNKSINRLRAKRTLKTILKEKINKL